jgi:hypothetical protein
LEIHKNTLRLRKSPWRDLRPSNAVPGACGGQNSSDLAGFLGQGSGRGWPQAHEGSYCGRGWRGNVTGERSRRMPREWRFRRALTRGVWTDGVGGFKVP